jgi:hypothetical protein
MTQFGYWLPVIAWLRHDRITAQTERWAAGTHTRGAARRDQRAAAKP